MIEQPPKEEILHLIKEIDVHPASTQRTISANLGFSLGKTNYILKALVKRGLITVRNFSANPNKLQKIQYSLTKKGIQERINLTSHFLERKEIEYNRMKQEWEQLVGKRGMPDLPPANRAT